jgi:hypothetical protein
LRALRNRLTYANVVATLALMIAVAGGTAYAANTVFSSDIVNGEVRTADISDANGVRSVDVRNDNLTGGGLGSVDIANDSLSGLDIAESTLQGVDAGTVGGLQGRKINFQVPAGTGPTTVLDLAGLRITAECQNFGDFLDVKAFTSKNGASVYYFAGTGAFADDTNSQQDIDSDMYANGLFNVGTTLQIDNATPHGGAPGGAPGDNSIGTLNYSAPDGSVVVAHLALDEVRSSDGNVDHCGLTGTAMGS